MAIFRRRSSSPDHRGDELLAQVEAGVERRARAEHAGMVRGRHYIDWVPTLNQWRTEKRDDEALPLLLEIIEAAERAAANEGWAPAPGYTKRAAVIYRRRKDLDGERAILERYIAACPPGTGHPDFVARLAKIHDTR